MAAYAKLSLSICPPIQINVALNDFMENDCDFAMEHADGSFKDHLAFFQDYTNAYLQPYSPRVGLLHSIMGVGTNYFPMQKDKIPKLKSLLSEFEYTHIEAFPSVLRLIFGTNMIAHVTKMLFDEADVVLEEIAMHRVIDNKRISLTGDEFWINLNYQLCHLLDFLPMEKWYDHTNDHPFCFCFASVYRLLLAAGRLQAKLDLDLPVPDAKKARRRRRPAHRPAYRPAHRPAIASRPPPPPPFFPPR